MSKNIGQDISKTLSGKYGQKLFDPAKQSATDLIKTLSKGAIQQSSKSNQWFNW